MTSTRRRVCAAIAVGLAGTAASLLGAGAAGAVPINVKVPAAQISVQMYSFSTYANNEAKLREVLAALKAAGYRSIEPYMSGGGPDANNGINPYGANMTAEQFRSIVDEYGLRIPARHARNHNESIIPHSKALGQEYIGTGNAPGMANLGQVENAARLLNRVGKASVESGTGKAYIHNHDGQFSTKITYNGKPNVPVWEVLMDLTDPRYVGAELDLFWAIRAGVDVPKLFETYGPRIEQLHVKDGIGSRQGVLGEGDINWDPILTAAKPYVRWYHIEIDPPGGAAWDTEWLPWLQKSFNNLVDPATLPGVKTFPLLFAQQQLTGTLSVPQPLTVTNSGTGPLRPTGVSIASDYDSANDFVVAQDGCTGATVAPGASCTVQVRFAPKRPNSPSAAKLVVAAADVPVPAQWTWLQGRSGPVGAFGDVGGSVSATLALALGAAPTFGTFLPGIEQTYTANASATVLSTAGDATLSVTDASATATGKLVNGPFSLSQQLQAKATSAAATGPDYAPVGGSATPAVLLSYAAPVSGDVVTLGFRQAVGANEPLRTGTYSKTLTFTLSTTTP